MATPTVDEVSFRVLKFYSTTNAQERKACDEWLQSFSKHEGAWEILNKLLESDGPPELHAWSARTMAWRVKNSKPDRDLSLKLQQVIVQHMFRLRGTSNIVHQLSTVIVELLKLRGNPELISEMCHSLGAQAQATQVLLSALSEIGKESGFILEDLLDVRKGQQVKTARADEAEITEEHPLLMSVMPNVGSVLQFLHAVWPAEASQQDNKKLMNSILGCYATWLRFGGAPGDLVQSNITRQCLQYLSDPMLCEEACAVLGELAIRRIENQGTSEDWGPVVGFFASSFNVIGHHLDSLLAGGPEGDGVGDIVRLVCRICRACADQLVTQPTDPMAGAMLNTLLRCTSVPGYEIVPKTIGTWGKVGQCITSLDDATKQRARTAFTAAYQKLIEICVRQAMYPAKSGEWTRTFCTDKSCTKQQCDHESGNLCDDEWDFNEFRKKELEDLIFETCAGIGEAEAIHLIFQLLFQFINDPSRSKWQEVEACFFFITSSHSSYKLLAKYLPQLFESHSKIPDNFRVKASYIGFLSKLGGWFKKDGAVVFDMVLGYIMHSSQDPRLETDVIQCVSKLAGRCPQLMLNVYGQLQSKMLSWDSLSISNSKDVMQTLGSLSCSMTTAQRTEAVGVICQNILERLQRALESQSAAGLQKEFQKLTSLYKGVDDVASMVVGATERGPIQQDWAKAFGGLWFVIKQVIQKAGQIDDVSEYLSGFISKVILTVGTASSPHLEGVISELVSLFERKPQSCVLYCFASVISVFGRNPSYQVPIMNVLELFIRSTVKLLAESAVGPNSDFVQELYYLVTKSSHTFQAQLLQAPVAATIFDVALAAIVDTDVSRSSCGTVMQYFISITESDSITPEALAATKAYLATPRGEQLYSAMMTAVVDRDLDTLDLVGVVVWNMMQYDRQDCLRLVFSGLQSLPPKVPEASRQKCIDSVAASKSLSELQGNLEKFHRDVPANWR
eukprot:TRINITY_DN6227_c0_g1_i1.p1 TRINITY_DN6227_c0_g1~~TRINITY_DN6227_c0_g1_i1.p1  ORF type:complete len:1004 (+),score=170.44 TRINITY_DN6227_c0_g1_i1:134-3013(+)